MDRTNHRISYRVARSEPWTLASIELVLASDGTVESVDDLTTLFDTTRLASERRPIDGKTQCQALDRTAPSTPVKPGRGRTMTHDYRRHATVDLFAGGARPPVQVIVEFVDEHREEFGVEPICRVLQMAPSTYYAAKKRELAPSARAVRDAAMMQILMVLWIANRKVYGAHKLWKAARRAGHDIGRDQVARLMRVMEIEGISRRRRKVFTTIADPDAVRAPDLVKRNFTAARPNALWVTDLTYVPTKTGMAYVCFIVDAFSRRIVGWRVAANMKTDMVLDALEMARRSRGSRRLVGLVTHADAGSLFTSVRFTERLDEIGAQPSIGTVADSYECEHDGGVVRPVSDPCFRLATVPLR